MRARNDENGTRAENADPVTYDLIHSRLGGMTINANQPNTPCRHFPATTAALPVIDDMDALIEALSCALKAARAIRFGAKGIGRARLDKGLVPSAKAFPAGSREAYAFAIWYGALIEAAA